MTLLVDFSDTYFLESLDTVQASSVFTKTK